MAELLDRYSLEMTTSDIGAVATAGELIDAGTEVSITYLPKDTPDARIATAIAVRRAGWVPVPHVSARRLLSREDLNAFLQLLSRQASVDRVFVVGGDPTTPEGPYEDALAIIRDDALLQHGIRKVGIAGYPEGHPRIAQEQLWTALRDKQAALAARGQSCEIVTQFSFNAEAVLRWLAQLRQEGITAPLKIGIPGPATAQSLLRYAARCGVGVSSKIMARYGLSLAKLLSPVGPELLIEELEGNLNPAVHGEVTLHLYPFGGLERTARWMCQFRSARRCAMPVTSPRTGTAGG